MKTTEKIGKAVSKINDFVLEVCDKYQRAMFKNADVLVQGAKYCLDEIYITEKIGENCRFVLVVDGYLECAISITEEDMLEIKEQVNILDNVSSDYTEWLGDYCGETILDMYKHFEMLELKEDLEKQLKINIDVKNKLIKI